MYKLFCALGIHLRVLSGGGSMGDALMCVDCGRNKYPEVFGATFNIRTWQGKIDETPEGRLREWHRAAPEACRRPTITH